jgi:hypothetical protein
MAEKSGSGENGGVADGNVHFRARFDVSLNQTLEVIVKQASGKEGLGERKSQTGLACRQEQQAP